MLLKRLFSISYRNFTAMQNGTPQSHSMLSTFDMFSIGLGPSSSHTVGPMRASKKWVDLLHKNEILPMVSSIKCELYGSLALTGVGHGTDYAILMGLEGETPETIDPESIPSRINKISKRHKLNLRNQYEITFIPIQDVMWSRSEQLAFDPNGIKYTAYNSENDIIVQEEYYSVGGGFVIHGDPTKHNAYRYVDEEAPDLDEYDTSPPYTFDNGM